MKKAAAISSLILKKRARKNQQQTRQEEMTESSSIGDMAFLLLIFFIVTGSFILRQGVFFSLPSQNASAIRVRESQLREVTPTSEGYLLEGRAVTRPELLRNLTTHFEKNGKDAIVLIRMDGALPYERMVDTVSAAREAGIQKVSLKREGADE